VNVSNGDYENKEESTFTIVASKEEIKEAKVTGEGVMKQSEDIADDDCCHLYCTRPSKTTCCLPCNERGSEDTHEFLLALLEGLTIHIDTMFTKDDYKWLRSRAWSENSHIGNRIHQGPFYFDWTRALQPEHICEIGFNGGHSGIIFLAATPRLTRVTAFDLQKYKYSDPGLAYVQKLSPGRLEMLAGSSFVTVPAYTKEHGRTCDIFSVDGDHSLTGAKKDLVNAIAATKVGGWIIMDDMTMQPRKSLQQVYDEAAPGTLGNLHCLDDVQEHVSHLDRYDNTTTLDIPVGWCWIQVLK
jgi:predicted O-methyltransferase YrrM